MLHGSPPDMVHGAPSHGLLGSPPDMVHGAPSHGAHPLYAEQRSTALSGSAAASERRVIAL